MSKELFEEWLSEETNKFIFELTNDKEKLTTNLEVV